LSRTCYKIDIVHNVYHISLEVSHKNSALCIEFKQRKASKRLALNDNIITYLKLLRNNNEKYVHESLKNS